MNAPENRITAFTSAAIRIFIPSLPITHGLGLFAHCPRAAKARHVLLYPVKGGRHHTIFQLISWVIWAASTLVAVPVLLQCNTMQIPESHTEILSAAAAVGSVFAELFMIQSLLVFDPKVNSSSSEQPSSPAYNRGAVPSKPLAGTMVVAMGALWVSMAGALVWATEYLENVTTKYAADRQMYIFLSGACLLVGVTTTHGLGGKLWHARSLGEEAADAWRFFQPFRGGAAFVATQALGWALFSAALTSLVWLVAQIAAGMAYCMRCWAVGTCSVMGAAYLVLGASIWIFQGPQKAKQTLAAAKAAVKELPRDMLPWTTLWLPILALYTPVHIFNFVLASSFALVPASYAAAFWVGTLVLYYALTSQDCPQHTGAREWPWMKAWLGRTLGPALRAWLGSLEVVYDGSRPFPADMRYIFGYSPHGLFPIGAPYLTLLPEFQALLPNVTPTPLIASVCFYTPVVRDLCSWCGLRQVSRATFLRALEERGSVMLVPGGQAELIHTWRLFKRREFVVYSRHKGFVRLAIEQNAALVPVVCLGEAASLRNAFDWPALQQWTYKNLGFPIPYLVVGRWGVTPFPRQTGVKFIIGEPLMPPPRTPDTQVLQSAVDELHTRYYEAIADLFRRHQPGFPGYEDVKLRIE